MVKEKTVAVITGGRGFLGSHLVEHLLKNTDWELVLFDKMGYASMPMDRIKDMDTWTIYKDRVKMYDIDLNLPVPQGIEEEVGEVDYIIHLAAESHVDNSIDHPREFILNNVSATINILEYARHLKNLKMFVNFSTDEVYGPAPEGKSFKEFEYHYPSNPYSASKSAQEAIGIAYSNTYRVPVITTHTMNLYGERQHPEKFIPKVIKSVLEGKEVEIHANEDKTKAGTRFYIHCRDLSDALLSVIRDGYHGYDEWNIAGLEEIDNLTLAKTIAGIIGKDLKFRMVDFHGSRPGHDLRYALDSTKLIEHGYTYPKGFIESLTDTVKWYLEHKEWLNEA